MEHAGPGEFTDRGGRSILSNTAHFAFARMRSGQTRRPASRRSKSRMKLNHLNLTVAQVSETREFLEKYFGLQGKINPYTGESMEGGKENRNFAVLFDDYGLVLTLIGAGKKAEVTYPASFHIGFIQESEERVNEINRRLKDDGFDVKPPERLHAWTFYVMAPGGFAVEVLC